MIFNKIFNRNSKITTGTTIGLTSIGKAKSESFEGQSKRFTILADLADNGVSSINDISKRTGIEREQVLYIVKNLKREGLVRIMDGEENGQSNW